MSWVSEVQADSPATWYRHDESSGLLQDSSGNANHATSLTEGGGAAVVTYQEPGAIASEPASKSIKYNRDGTLGCFFTVPDHATLDVGNTFTIEFWIKLDDVTATAMYPFSKSALAYEIRINTSDQIELVKSEAYIVVTATSAIPRDNAFHHVVAVRPGTNQGLIYLDKVDVSGTPASGSDFADNANALKIGSIGDQHLDGWFDEVALYPTALSAARVAAHYDAAIATAFLRPARRRGR